MLPCLGVCVIESMWHVQDSEHSSWVVGANITACGVHTYSDKASLAGLLAGLWPRTCMNS